MTEITQAEISELFYDTDLMEALKGEAIPTRKQGQGITAKEYAKCYNISDSTAMRTLNGLVEDGKLKKTKMIFNSTTVTVFEKK